MFKKYLIEMSGRDIMHGKRSVVILEIGIEFGFRKRHGGEGRVEMEGEFVRAPGLAVGQARILFAVTKQKFDLKTGFVIPIQHKAVEVDIRRKKDDVIITGIILNIGYAQVAFQPWVVHNCGENRDVVIRIAGLEAGQVGVLAIHFAVIAFWTPGSGLSRPGIEIAQIGILAQFTDEVEVRLVDNRIKKLFFRGRSVIDDIVGQFFELRSPVNNLLGIKIDPALIVRQVAGCLERFQVERGVLLHVHQGQFADFQSHLGFGDAAIPKFPQIGGMFFTFGHKTAISGQNTMVRARLVDEESVEFKKIKGGFEMGAIGFFRIPPITRHIQKIEPRWYAHKDDKNMREKFFANKVDSVHSS